MRQDSLSQWMDMIQAPTCPMPDWLETFRNVHVAALQHSLPNSKHERFRHTDFSAIQKSTTTTTTDFASVNISPKVTDDSIRLVFINHVFQPKLSDIALLPDDVVACSLNVAIEEHPLLLKEMLPTPFSMQTNPLACLNIAAMQNGFVFYMPPTSTLTKPLHFLHLSDNSINGIQQGLQFIMLDEHTNITLFEEIIGCDTVFNNQLSAITLQKNAVFNHITLHKGHNDARGWRTTAILLKENATASLASCVANGKSIRHDLSALLQESFATCKTQAFYSVGDKTIVENHLDMRHMAPHTTSDMLFKGTLNDRAKAIFNGRVYVEKNAQKIVAHQENHHLLFSDFAESYAKPELEIYADDVKCKHGATTAAFDQDAIFYLRSRGLSENQAKALLLDAFLQSILDRITLPSPFIDYLKSAVREVLHEE